MKEMSIGEVARAAGINSSAIRYYESMGLIPTPSRVGGKRRYFSEAILRLEKIQLAKDTGFTIHEIQKIFKAQDSRGRGAWEPFATQKLQELDARLINIKLMKKLLLDVLNCPCEGPAECSVRQKRQRPELRK